MMSARIQGVSLPYNKAFDLSARGRHILRLREGCAGTPTGAALPRSPFGPCSQLNAMLYGRWKMRKEAGSE